MIDSADWQWRNNYRALFQSHSASYSKINIAIMALLIRGGTEQYCQVIEHNLRELNVSVLTIYWYIQGESFICNVVDCFNLLFLGMSWMPSRGSEYRKHRFFYVFVEIYWVCISLNNGWSWIKELLNYNNSVSENTSFTRISYFHNFGEDIVTFL